jgi:signal transduction histidine kinase
VFFVLAVQGLLQDPVTHRADPCPPLPATPRLPPARHALDGPQDELKELGDTLDGLFARLEGAFDAQRHFVANASHELQTPLTAERNLLQVALDDPDTTNAQWRSTAEEVPESNDEQAHLIDSLLTLASSEGV